MEVFTQKDLETLHHPSYVKVAEAINSACGSLEFADDMLTVLQSFIIDKKEANHKTWIALMTG